MQGKDWELFIWIYLKYQLGDDRMANRALEGAILKKKTKKKNKLTLHSPTLIILPWQQFD